MYAGVISTAAVSVTPSTNLQTSVLRIKNLHCYFKDRMVTLVADKLKRQWL